MGQIIGNPPGGLTPATMLVGGMNTNLGPNLPTGILTKIPFNLVITGFPDGIEDIVNNRITPGVTGMYHISASVRIENHNQNVSWNHLEVFVGGVGVAVAYKALLNYGTAFYEANTVLATSIVYKVFNFQNIEVYAMSNAPAPVSNILPDSRCTFLTIHQVR